MSDIGFEKEKTVLSIKADWETNKPKKAILYRDSKFFHLDIVYSEERVAVLKMGLITGTYLFIFIYTMYISHCCFQRN